MFFSKLLFLSNWDEEVKAFSANCPQLRESFRYFRGCRFLLDSYRQKIATGNYINLIEQLLTCANGEEPNILQANQELIDPEFLQMMENYATGLE